MRPILRIFVKAVKPGGSSEPNFCFVFEEFFVKFLSQLPGPGARYCRRGSHECAPFLPLDPSECCGVLGPFSRLVGWGGGLEMWEEFSLGRTKAESRICGQTAQESALRPRFTGLARARDRSSLHIVRKENNGRKSWFRTSTVSCKSNILPNPASLSWSH